MRRPSSTVTAEHRELRAHLESAPEVWLPTCAAEVFSSQMAPFHREFWRLVWECREDYTPDPILLALFRGAGKSISAELATLALGLMGRRRYALYVSGTQRLADDHLEAIKALWAGSEILQTWYPDAVPTLTRETDGKGRGRWTRTRLTLGNGFTIDAVGLDSSFRGAKQGTQRPDAIVLDEFDELGDSKAIAAKKLAILTASLFPAASASGALVIVVQNLIARHSVMSQLVDPKRKVLQTARLIGPVPMIERAEWGFDDKGRRQILGGKPTWPARFPLAAIQAKVLEIGEAAFRSEEQHELLAEASGALWLREVIRSAAWPRSDLVVVGVDPAAKGKATSDETGLLVVGGHRGRWAVLDDRSAHFPSATWPEAAVRAALDYGATVIAYEDNVVGDAGTRLLVAAARRLGWRGQIVPRTATESKSQRADPVVAAYGRGEVIHARAFEDLEDEMCLWVPGVSTWSPNRLDALVWALRVAGVDAIGKPEQTLRRSRAR